MKITVLGCGAIGKLWLAALSQQKHQVQGWLKTSQSYLSVHIDEINGEVFNQPIPTNSNDHLANSELLIVCLKAWQVADAVNDLLPKLSADCPILLLHNGMGTQEKLLSAPNPILLGVTTHGAYQNAQQVYHTASGLTYIGSATPNATGLSSLANVLHRSLPNVAWHDEILSISWLKLAANCVINPLTALYECRNGDLLRYPEQLNLLCEEIIQVMQRENIPISIDNLTAYVYDVIERTAKNYSSMLQDVRAKRRTEIDYITGYLLRRSYVHGLATPENTRIYNLIKHKEDNHEYFSTHLPGSR
ncbi:2-dehydropantoate 2-reductase [Photorhabdus heterorhabditis]|uniref:2-dehydropantoate 2-reductase n=1 Tax=Photorhabdus heterorhabditis TaxID=880156 RepID=A0A5B0XAJ9_9GAMM|nr:2-dehydropantoate 2-reductase [Photorhabdus heterorhabditis]KAA1195487.1 2-dehydropantoate 2-reductase [Photorhabdus heterorhabditis]